MEAVEQAFVQARAVCWLWQLRSFHRGTHSSKGMTACRCVAHAVKPDQGWSHVCADAASRTLRCSGQRRRFLQYRPKGFTSTWQPCACVRGVAVSGAQAATCQASLRAVCVLRMTGAASPLLPEQQQSGSGGCQCVPRLPMHRCWPPIPCCASPASAGCAFQAWYGANRGPLTWQTFGFCSGTSCCSAMPQRQTCAAEEQTAAFTLPRYCDACLHGVISPGSRIQDTGLRSVYVVCMYVSVRNNRTPALRDPSAAGHFFAVPCSLTWGKPQAAVCC